MRTAADPDDLLGKAYDSRVARRLIAQVRPYRTEAWIALSLVVVTTILDLSVLYLFGIAIDVIDADVGRTFLGRSGSDALDLIALTFLVVILLRFVGRNRELYVMSRLGQKIVYDLRSAMFRHIQKV